MMKRYLALTAIVLSILVFAACGTVSSQNESVETEVTRVEEQPLEEDVTPPSEVTIGHQTFSTDVEELVLDAQLQSNQPLDLSLLKWCSNLKVLTVNLMVNPHVYFDEAGNIVVSEMAPVDLSPLAELDHLEDLCLNVGKVADLAPLAQMSALRQLCLVVDGAMDLSPLANCARLEELVLEGSGSVDLAPLSRCAELNYLRLCVIDENGETPDLSDLSGAPKLETLSLAGHRGLAELKDVPLRCLYDLNHSTAILEELPKLSTLETVQISDRYLTDISPLLENETVKYLTLVVDTQAIPQTTIITADNRDLLDQLITGIEKDQLSEFLNRNDGSIMVFYDFNRTDGFSAYPAG